MTSLDARFSLCQRWFGSTQGRIDGAHGWGWVSDVPPNPQNTAEVVCALEAAALPVPNPAGVERLIRTHVVDSARGDWVFREPIDVAWRLRALRCLTPVTDDPDVVAGVHALQHSQLSTGGWRMAGSKGPASVTATANAVLAIISSGQEQALGAAAQGVGLLVAEAVAGRPTGHQLYADAYTAHLLAQPPVSELAGKGAKHARALACDRLLDYLTQRRYQSEEETFSRDGMVETWRHLTLPLALRALAAAEPDAIFEPAFRDGLVTLLSLQDTAPSHINYGGFRTSPEGFVTSYATTQALDVMTHVRHSLAEQVNPAIAFDLICNRRSAHHSDPQTLVTVASRALIMNSTAGMAVMSLAIVAGVGLTLAAVLLNAGGEAVASRLLLVLGSLVAGLGISSYLATRLHRTPGHKIAVVSFTLFTALVLPVLTFILY